MCGSEEEEMEDYDLTRGDLLESSTDQAKDRFRFFSLV